MPARNSEATTNSPTSMANLSRSRSSAASGWWSSITTTNRERKPIMGTRAVYTFIHDADERYSVYKHWDGCPRWGCRFIANGLKLAWPLPRFEANEFAAAFVAANKKQAGDIYLTSRP